MQTNDSHVSFSVRVRPIPIESARFDVIVESFCSSYADIELATFN